MQYKKIILLLTLFNFLIIILLAAVSFRFVAEQIDRSKRIDESEVAEYNVILEVNLIKQLVKKINP
jgi:hypothetical protein